MTPPKISFIVPLFNHLHHTRVMLESLLESLPAGLEYEVVVVDDFSTDGTREWLGHLALPGFKVVLNPRNLGYAASNNIGAAHAEGEVLGLLNNDLLLSPGWLEPMLQALHAPALKAGVVGNVQLRVADGAVDHAGVVLSPAGQFEHLQVLPAGNLEPHRCLAVTGACMLVRRAQFLALGGFDEGFINGCEDIDLCFRLRAAGAHACLVPASRIRHHVSLSRSRSTSQNDLNSRRLFGTWRRDIKRELSEVWLRLLQAGPAACQDHVQGHLSASFMGTPLSAARTLAEAALRREEAQWSRNLGEPDPNADVARRCTAQGLRFDPALQAYRLVGAEAQFVVGGLDSARNFFVCGRTLHDVRPDTLALTLCVNGLQQHTVPLGPHRDFNAGLVAPLVLPGLNNRFEVRVHAAGAPAPGPDTASASVVLTHIVIDDHEIRRF